MDIKVLIQYEIYWPQDTSDDCNSTYGSYSRACVIPDSYLTGCYALKNSTERFLYNDQHGNLKITIYDEDILSDDFIDIFVPKAKWYDPLKCGVQSIVISSSVRTAYFKITVSSEVTVPSLSPTLGPTSYPMRRETHTPTISPTKNPTISLTNIECGIN